MSPGSLARRASMVGASVRRPGTLLSSTYQTLASSSYLAVTTMRRILISAARGPSHLRRSRKARLDEPTIRRPGDKGRRRSGVEPSLAEPHADDLVGLSAAGRV